MNKQGLLLHHRVLPQLQKVSSDKEEKVLGRKACSLLWEESAVCVICTVNQSSVTFVFVLCQSV